MKRLALVLLAACSAEPLRAEGHVVVRVSTDAPLPSLARRGSDPYAPSAFFDTLRIEVHPPGADRPCAGCTREFDATVERMSGGATFTVKGTPGARVHVVLFQAIEAARALPAFRLESWITLPPPPAEGAREIAVRLAVDDLGRPRSSVDAPGSGDEGEPLAPGSWAGAQRRGCPAAAPAGTICVPGGAFVMGDAVLTGFGEFDADVRRVVTLEPFYVDAHELTVGEYRAGGGAAGPKDLIAWSGSMNGDAFEDWCTYTRERGPHEDHPVNCIGHAAARAFCLSRGGDLPTEAQLEYLIGGLANLKYPWGKDRPLCDEAVYGLGGWPGFPDTSSFADFCRAADGPRERVIGYPHAHLDGSVRKRDYVDVRGQRIIDLGGNLSEWARDGFAPQTSPCWSAPILHDPVCASGSERVIRGGSWLQLQIAAGRGAIPANQANLIVGFRCALPIRGARSAGARPLAQ